MFEYLPDQIDDDENEYWLAWDELPLPWRDWLLWYVPGWWSLPRWMFRRVLLRTAYLIVRRGLSPQIALRQVATRLRLPPPRPTRRMPPRAARAAARPIRSVPIMRPIRLRPLSARPIMRRPIMARPRFAPAFRRGGFRGGGFRPRFR
jgi:hypothetical protein